MKKNTMMRIASFLLIAVLLSTSAISGTYAKYVTEGTGSDSARVAKFGVTVTHDNNIFYDAYKDTYVTYTANEMVDTITVQAGTKGTDVVAPGTEGAMTNFDISGTPEVDVQVTYKVDLALANWVVDADNDGDYDDNYCPIVITVNGNDFYNIDAAALESAVESHVNTIINTYHTNTDLVEVEDDLQISWRWYFEDVTPGNPVASFQTDVLDTKLGNWKLNGQNEPTISITATCKITQID